MLGFLFATALVSTGTSVLLDPDGLTRQQRRERRQAVWMPELGVIFRPA